MAFQRLLKFVDKDNLIPNIKDNEDFDFTGYNWLSYCIYYIYNETGKSNDAIEDKDFLKYINDNCPSGSFKYDYKFNYKFKDGIITVNRSILNIITLLLFDLIISIEINDNWVLVENLQEYLETHDGNYDLLFAIYYSQIGKFRNIKSAKN